MRSSGTWSPAGVKIDRAWYEAKIRANATGDVVDGQFANTVDVADCGVLNLMQSVKGAACCDSLFGQGIGSAL